MRGSHICWAVAALCLLLCGCTLPVKDAAGAPTLSVDWRTLIESFIGPVTWQTGVLFLLAYLANSRSQLATVAGLARKILQTLKLIPGEKSREEVSAEEAARLLSELISKLRGQPALIAELGKLQVATLTSEVPSSAP